MVFLSVGALAMLGPDGPLNVFLGPSSAARVARRLLVVSPDRARRRVVGRLQGDEFGLYAPGNGTSLVVMGIVVLLAVAIWQTARVAERTENARRAAIDELDRFFDLSVDMLAAVDVGWASAALQSRLDRHPRVSRGGAAGASSDRVHPSR